MERHFKLSIGILSFVIILGGLNFVGADKIGLSLVLDPIINSTTINQNVTQTIQSTLWVDRGDYIEPNETNNANISTGTLIIGVPSCTEALETTTNGTVICGTDETGAGASYNLNVSGDSGNGVILDSEIFSIIGGGAVSTSMSGNTLTVTGTDTDTDTQKSGGSPYLYNDSTTIYLNETVLNTTIDDRDSDTTYTAGTDLDLAGAEFSLEATLDSVTTINGFFDTACSSGQFATIVTSSGGYSCASLNGTDVYFTAIFSDDWSNVTITESQISDLSHTVDTANTTEEMQDAVWGYGIGTTTRITVTYQDASNNVDFIVDDMNDDDPEPSDVWWSDLTDEGVLGYNNLSKCSDGEILKVSGSNWVCGTDATGGGGGGDGMWIDGGNYIYPNSTFANNIDVYGWIKSHDWTNVTITEAQITDLSHTTDTNTQKEGGGYYLYNDTTAIYLNESRLNNTIDQRDSDTTYSDLSEFTDSGNLYQDDITGSCTASQTLGSIADNGATSCQSISITESQISDLAHTTDTDTWNTTEEMQDACGSLLGGTETRITVTYQDASNNVDFIVDDMNDDDPEPSDVWWSDLTDEGVLGYNNLSKCSDGEILKVSGSNWVCGTDNIGGGGGTSSLYEQGDYLHINTSATNAVGISLNLTNNPQIPAIRLQATYANDTGKPTIGWYTQDGSYIGYIVCHNLSSDGNSAHKHCSIETLDNQSGTPSINSHFEVSWDREQKRANISFPTSDVSFNSDQKLYFGDSWQADIVHNSVTGDLELKANADILINATQLDVYGGDITGVDDIFSSTGATLDVKPDADFRIFPDGQTTRGLTIGDDGANIDINGMSVGSIDFLDPVTVSGNLTGTNDIIIPQNMRLCFDGSTCTKYIYYNGTDVVIQG